MDSSLDHAIPRIAKLSLTPDEYTSEELSPGIGLVVPFDFALDAECWRWMPEHIPLFITRTPWVEETAVTVNLAKEVSRSTDVTNGVGSLKAAKPACIAYGYTSGSFINGKEGESTLRQAMRDGGAVKAVTTSGALIQALDHIKAKRVAIATHYNEELSRLLGAYIEECGVEVVANGYMDKEEGIARVSYDAVRYLAALVDRPEADVIFFSCTNLRTFDVIEELELYLGKPVLSANQVTIWAALKEASLSLPSLNQSLFRSSPGEVAPVEELSLTPVS